MVPLNAASSCPCGGGSWASCCGRFLNDHQHAETAEQLMRSRYSAYVIGRIDYLIDTVDPAQRHHHDPAAIAQWSQQAEWLGLTVERTIAGAPTQTVGLVEFTSRWREPGGAAQNLHEFSFFKQLNNRWYYVDGSGAQRIPGRKEPCICGSGKAFKRCCGR